MKRFFGIIAVYFIASIKSKFEYRGAFIANAFGFVLGYGTQFFLIWILVSRFNVLNGWEAFEIMLLYSLSIVSYTLANIFLGGPTRQLSEKIRTGFFDQTLISPMHPFAYEVASSFSSYYFTHFLVGISFIVICLVNLNIALSLTQLFFLIVFIIGSALIQGGIMLMLNTTSFWLIGDNPLARELFMSLRQLIEYPLSIYPRILQIVLTFIIPFGFISFYPAQYILSKNDFLMFSPMLQFLNPLVGIVIFTVALFFWNFGIRNYKSSGS